jgi:hypothetical protein
MSRQPSAALAGCCSDTTLKVYNLKLLQRLNSIKYFWAISRIRWLNGESTNVSGTEVFLETLVYSPFSQLAQKYLIER